MSPDDTPHATQGRPDDKPAGPDFVFLGQLSKPHGLRGEMRLFLDEGYEWLMLEQITTLFLGDDYRPYDVGGVRLGPKAVLLALKGVDNRDAAELLRDTDVYARADDLPDLPEDQYYAWELIGLQVSTDTGEPLGELTEVLVTGANDVYVVRGTTYPELLLPDIPDCILAVDLDAGTMTVHLMDGLLPD